MTKEETLSADEVLNQLLYKHEDTLTGFARELGGEDADCAIRDRSGNFAWDSEIARPVPTSPEVRDALPVGWVIPLAKMGWLEVRAPVVPEEAPVELPSIGRFLVCSMETEEELDRLLEDHIANTNQLVALYHIIAATHGTWALADKLDVMVEEAGRQIGTSIAFLRVTQEGQDHFALWPGNESFRRERAEQILARCAEATDAFVGEEPERFVAAPILVRDRIVGWLGAGERPVGDPLGQRDVKHVSALAELAAGFLQTARLQDQVVATTKMQRELEIASQIQDMLMPRELPEVKGVGVAASCRPASSVGGDFFVVQKLEDGRLAFALGDVTGKGVPAALIMAMARTVFRSLTPLSVGADTVLGRLSNVLFDDLEEVGKFVTMVLGFWDPDRRRLQIANAGHSPVLYRPHFDAPFVSLEPEQPPLGVLPDLVGAPLDLEFGPGAVFLACSDGVTEARDPKGGFYGDERLQTLVQTLGNASAERIRTQILEDVELFSDGAPQSDDQTMLVLTHVTEAVAPVDLGGAVDVKFLLTAETGQLPMLNAEFDRALARVAGVGTTGLVGDEMKLAVHEAVANLIEHAGLAPEAEIVVRLEMGPQGIVVEIEAGGRPFDPGQIEPSPPAPEELLEGGYGLHLIHCLTDSIDYEPGPERHRLRLTRGWRTR